MASVSDMSNILVNMNLGNLSLRLIDENITPDIWVYVITTKSWHCVSSV